jgi:hypothetical protein
MAATDNFFFWLVKPCLLMDRDKMSNLYRGPSIDASYQVSVHMAEGFQKWRLKYEKLTDDRQQTPSDGFKSFTVATMTWLTVTEYCYHKWPRICSVCRNRNPSFSSFMIYHRVCYKSKTTGAGRGTGAAYPSGAHELIPDFSRNHELWNIWSTKR